MKTYKKIKNKVKNKVKKVGQSLSRVGQQVRDAVQRFGSRGYPVINAGKPSPRVSDPIMRKKAPITVNGLVRLNVAQNLRNPYLPYLHNIAPKPPESTSNETKPSFLDQNAPAPYIIHSNPISWRSVENVHPTYYMKPGTTLFPQNGIPETFV